MVRTSVLTKLLYIYIYIYIYISKEQSPLSEISHRMANEKKIIAIYGFV